MYISLMSFFPYVYLFDESLSICVSLWLVSFLIYISLMGLFSYVYLFDGSLSICISLFWAFCCVFFLHKGAGLFDRSLFKCTSLLRVSFYSSFHSSLGLFSLVGFWSGSLFTCWIRSMGLFSFVTGLCPHIYRSFLIHAWVCFHMYTGLISVFDGSLLMDLFLYVTGLCQHILRCFLIHTWICCHIYACLFSNIFRSLFIYTQVFVHIFIDLF